MKNLATGRSLSAGIHRKLNQGLYFASGTLFGLLQFPLCKSYESSNPPPLFSFALASAWSHARPGEIRKFSHDPFFC